MKIRNTAVAPVRMSPIERSMGRLMRAPDGHEGGDDPAGDPPPADDPPADDPPAGDPPAEAERPEWLPEKFWDAEGKAPNLENLAKSYAKLETLRGDPDKLKEEWEAERLAARPEAPDKYALPEHDALDPEALAASPVVQLARQFAFENGANQEQFEGLITAYAESEMKQIETRFTEEMAKLGDNAKARAEAVGLWAKNSFDDQQYAAIEQITTTAAGVEAMEKMMDMLKKAGVDFEGEGDPGGDEGDTIDSIRALMNTREYWDSKKRDPAVVKRVEDFFAKNAKGK